MLNETSEYTEEDYLFMYEGFFISEIILAILAYLLNFTVMAIYVNMASNNKQKSSNCMLFIQAMTDIIVTITLTLTAVMCDIDFLITIKFYTMWIFFLEFSQYLAINTLLLITLDRFLAVNYPYFHRKNITIKTILLSLTIALLLSALPSVTNITLIIPNEFSAASLVEREKNELMKLKYHIIMGVVILVEILTVFMLLLSLYSTVRQSINSRIKTYTIQHTSLKRQSRIDSEKKKHRRVIAIILTLCVVYTVTYLPYAIMRICFFSWIQNVISGFLAEALSHSLALFCFSTALINPVTTLGLKEDYRNMLFRKYGSNFEVI